MTELKPAEVCALHCGHTPLVVSVPHAGTEIPADQQHRYTQRALAVEDTDWFLDRLYGFAREIGASLLVPRFSRYLIDLNRPSDDTPMYEGVNNTELCPTRHFTGEPIYRPGLAPDVAEIRRRVRACWQPYHDALGAEVERLRAAHGHAVVFDGHSIKSELPWLFEGRLPHMSIGTVAGSSCAPDLHAQIAAVLTSEPRYSHVIDGRFKGGYITRRYARPADGVHTVQLEMCWRAYMEEAPPYLWHDERAAEVTPLLRRLLQTLRDWKPA